MSDRFVLLRDFAHAYDSFPLRVTGDSAWLEPQVLSPMVEALRVAVAALEIHELSALRSRTASALGDSYFSITLDGGTYFDHCDYHLDMTRACRRYTDKYGKYRVPRVDTSSLLQQLAHLRRYYRQAGASKPIALCDDGIGTGDSMALTVACLSQLGLHPSRLFVLLNPAGVHSIKDVDVETLLDPEETDYNWLSERDLYWGLPRSGLSLVPVHSLQPVYGIPYTIDTAMVTRRIGLDREPAVAFRAANLEYNAIFWEQLESERGRPFTFWDCARLRFLGDQVNPNTRIVDYLRAINHPEFVLGNT
jgi:hypothetical protein